MTDQSKIPVPPSGPSLIERASGSFDFRALIRPVVADLPPAPAPRIAAAPDRKSVV